MQNKKPIYRLFIDEMGNHHFPKNNYDINNRFLCLAGVIYKISEIDLLTSAKRQLVSKYWKPDYNIILHREEILHKRGPYIILNNQEIRTNFNKDLLSLLNTIPCLYVTVVLDKLAHKEKYGESAYEPYGWCLTILLQRFTKFLKQINSLGDVLIEARGKNEDKTTKSIFKKVYETGCPFHTHDHYQKYLTSKEIKLALKKDDLIGLQIADIVGCAIQNKILYEKKHKDNFPGTFNMSIYEQIKDNIFHDKTGGTYNWGETFLP